MKHLSKCIVMLFLLAACVDSGNKYKDEELLLRYTEKNNYNEEHYSLLFLRVKATCKGCIPDHEIAIDSVMQMQDIQPLYIICDDSSFAESIQQEFASRCLFQIIIEKSENLQPYGLHTIHPLFFQIKKGRIEKWKIYK